MADHIWFSLGLLSGAISTIIIFWLGNRGSKR